MRTGRAATRCLRTKTYRNEGGLLNEDVFEDREAGRFIECAALQGELAANGGKSDSKGDARWAPIY